MVDGVTTRVYDMYTAWQPPQGAAAGPTPAKGSPAPASAGGNSAAGATPEEDAITAMAMRRMASFQRAERKRANQELTKQVTRAAVACLWPSAASSRPSKVAACRFVVPPLLR